MAPKKKSKAESSSNTTLIPTKVTPKWPPFTPLIPESDLSLRETLPGQIVTVPNFWTATLCKNYVSFLSSLPLVRPCTIPPILRASSSGTPRMVARADIHYDASE
jgi:hypothetical protein